MNLINGKLHIALGLLIIVAKGLAEIDTTQWPVRIVGGTDVAPGHHVPYQVSLQYSLNSTDNADQTIMHKHYCGGSIISRYHILTAAHCCDGFIPSRMSIVAGVRDLNDPVAVRLAIDGYTIHPNYVELASSDIAVIKLSSPLALDNITMAAIEVTSKERVSAGTNVILTGWGLRIPFQIEIPFSWPYLQEQLNVLSIPTVLQIMSFTTISDFECKLTIEQLSETEMCAKAYFFAGACSGDSGGPLVMSTENGLRQVGLVSYGLFVCGIFNALIPDVYTRVSEFADWIQQRMNS